MSKSFKARADVTDRDGNKGEFKGGVTFTNSAPDARASVRDELAKKGYTVVGPIEVTDR